MDYYKLKVLNNKRKVIVVIVIIVVILLLSYYFFVYKKNDISNEDKHEVITKKEEVVNSSDLIVVDIKGHVNKPGVYSFKKDNNTRINDLINEAGGLLKDADTSMINLSKKIEDEMIIIVYSKNEVTNFTKTQDDLRKKLEICENKIKNDACINAITTKNSKININEASLSELESLSGIGKGKAEAILEYRKKNKFKTIEDIMNVDGIGESLFASIKESITV